MTDTVTLYDACKRCGGMEGVPPQTYGEHAWMDCGACGEPVITWSDFKRFALDHAAGQLRQSADAKLGRRQRRR